MGAGSLQAKLVVQQLVDQNPVWFDVTVSMSAQIASKLVISILGGKSFLGEK